MIEFSSISSIRQSYVNRLPIPVGQLKVGSSLPIRDVSRCFRQELGLGLTSSFPHPTNESRGGQYVCTITTRIFDTEGKSLLRMEMANLMEYRVICSSDC